MGWYSAVRPLLFAMEPERAHERVTGLLSMCQRSELALSALHRFCSGPSMPVEVAGLRFPNPIGLAAGFDKDARLVLAAASLGFGFVEVGTVTPRPQEGNPRPRVFRYPGREALVNRLGFNNAGAEAAARRLAATPRGIPVGVNVGKSATTPLDEAANDYVQAMDALHPHADYFTLNISSPNTAELRRLHEPSRLAALLDAVAGFLARKGPKPLFLKLSPDAGDAELENAARAALDYKLGLIATNTTVDRTGMEGLESGGLSGRPLASRATSVLRKLKALTGGRVPLIGVGGIFTVEDARERLAAGADLVQVYTGLIYRGPGLVRELLSGLAQHPREARA